MTIACVTGATGMIGRRIVARLLAQGFAVRVLSRRPSFPDGRVELHRGELEDAHALEVFLRGARLLFHCAAELNDASKMWEVNYHGSERLLQLAERQGIEYLCHLSSAGVVGRTRLAWVDEEAACNPQNPYERSKWAAEQVAARGIEGCRVVILRPTNVVDEDRPGAIGLAARGSWKDRLHVFVKGGECAHVVHAEDVAAAALHFIRRPAEGPQTFFVSCDEHPLNTVGGISALYWALQQGRTAAGARPAPHLPLLVPHVLRRLRRRASNRGDVRYSCAKLSSQGFDPPLGLVGCVERVLAARSAPIHESVER